VSRGSANAASSYLPGSLPKPSPTFLRSTTSSSGLISATSSMMVRKIGTSGPRVLIDTSILVDLKKSELFRLSAKEISTLTVAELVKGHYAAVRDLDKERRRRHLCQVEATIEALPFDLGCARAFGSVAIAVEQIGRRSRGSRSVDLMIAATALAHDLPLYTLNPKDLRGLESLIEIVDVG
jgi:predicted nucleic acid-binding protein